MPQKKVTASKLNVRKDPEVQKGNRIGQLSNGDMIDVSNAGGGWSEFDYNGDNAFVSSQYLERVAQDEAPAAPSGPAAAGRGAAAGAAARAASGPAQGEQEAGVEDKDTSPWFEEAVTTVAGWSSDLVAWWDDVETAAEQTAVAGTEWWQDVAAWWEAREEPQSEMADQLDQETVEVVEQASPEQEPVETPEESGYFSHPDAGQVTISYGENAVPLNGTAEHLLKSILASVGLKKGHISSTLRTYADQARINYNQNSESQILNWYGAEVHAAWVQYHAEGRSTAEFAEFLEERDNNRGRVMSKHLSGLCLDLAPHNSAYASKLAELVPVPGSGVKTYLAEKGCTHTEFTFEVC